MESPDPYDTPVERNFAAHIVELEALIATMRENAVEREGRIAELEAENERLREWGTAIGRSWQLDGVGPKTLQKCLDSMSDLITQETERAEQAEAELAALKARRCWVCRAHVYLSHGGNFYAALTTHDCPMFGRDFEADGFCHRWQERGK